MTNIKLLSKVKTCLRITTDIFDEEEILPLIDSAYVDLKGAGVNLEDKESQVLIEQAVIFYCRAYFGTSPNRSWASHYKALRDSIALRKMLEVSENE